MMSYLGCCKVLKQSLRICCLLLRELAVISRPFIASVVF